MEWYFVIKTIKGRRYRYRQRTWRLGARVCTRSQYISPEVIIGYHGTFAKFERFNAAHLGSANECDSSQEGFFFASNPKVAASYASTKIARRRGLEVRIKTIEARIKSMAKIDSLYLAEDALNDDARFDAATANTLKHFFAMRRRAYDKFCCDEITTLQVSKRAEVKVCRLELHNPYIHDMRHRRFDDEEFCEAAWEAQAGGHDGVIIRNTYDPGSCFSGRSDDITNVYIVFDADKIRTIASQKSFERHTPSSDT